MLASKIFGKSAFTQIMLLNQNRMVMGTLPKFNFTTDRPVMYGVFLKDLKLGTTEEQLLKAAEKHNVLKAKVMLPREGADKVNGFINFNTEAD